MIERSFADCVSQQIELLQAGKPLAAFDKFFAADGVMFANDTLFATGAGEARRKQEPFINTASLIEGMITEVRSIEVLQICVFRNKTSFNTSEGVRHQIDGLCWQQWRSGKIIEERYYDNSHMRLLIAQGVLKRPDMMIEAYRGRQSDGSMSLDCA